MDAPISHYYAAAETKPSYAQREYEESRRRISESLDYAAGREESRSRRLSVVSDELVNDKSFLQQIFKKGANLLLIEIKSVSIVPLV